MSFKSIPSTGASESTLIGRILHSFARSISEPIFSDNPSARVQFLLGDEDQDEDDEEHKPHDLFIELDELVADGEKTNEAGEPVDQGWKETAR